MSIAKELMGIVKTKDGNKVSSAALFQTSNASGLNVYIIVKEWERQTPSVYIASTLEAAQERFHTLVKDED